MKKILLNPAMLVAAFVLAFASCDTILVGPNVTAGLYTYTAYDDSDSSVVTGIIVLRNSSAMDISGTWQWVTFTGVSAGGRFTMKKR